MSFICQYCKKGYSRNTNLIKHQNTAKFCLQKRGILKTPDPTLVPIQPIKARKKAPINNETLTAKKPIETILLEDSNKLSIFNITKGAEGYAKFAAEIFKNDITVNKKSIEFLDLKGETVIDPNAKKLTHLFFKGISSANKKLLDAEYREIQRKVQTASQEGKAGYAEVDIIGLLTNSSKIYDLLINSKDAENCQDNDLTRDFVKYLFKLLV